MENLATVAESSTPAKPVVVKKEKKPIEKKAAAPTKKASTEKKQPTKKEPVAKSRGAFPLTAKIKMVTKENPHRKGTNLHKYFSKYKDGMTVQQALDAGIVWANLHYLAGLEHIKIG